MEEDPHAPGPSINKLYFPASVFFGNVQALPGPEDVEYPERDLADKLVRIPACHCPSSADQLKGRGLFLPFPFPHACY